MAVQITGAQIKNSAVSTNQLSDASVSTAKLQDSSISSAKIQDASIVSSKIGTGAINNSAMFANSVMTAAKMDLTGVYDYSSGTLRATTPSGASDVATKNYVDSAVSSDIYWKEPCRVASTANINLASAPSAIDGVSLSANDRVLIKDQSTSSQNGVYVWASAGAAMTRASDCDSASEINGAAAFIKEGSTNADQGFVQTAEVVNLGSDTVTFVQFTGLGQIEAGDGLAKTGNRLDVSTGDGIQILSDAVAINEGAGLVIAGGAVDVDVDDSSIEISGSNKVQIKANGITSAMIGTNQVTGNEIAASTVVTANLADSSVTAVKLGASSVNASKLASSAVETAKIANNAVDATKIATSVAGDGLTGGNGSALAVNVDDSSIEVATDTVQLKDLGVSTAKLANNCVQTSKILDANVTGPKLAATVAGDGLSQNGSGNLDVSVGNGIQISGDAVTFRAGAGLVFAGADVDVQVDDSSIEIDGSGNLQVKGNGISNAMIQANAVQTGSIQDDAVTFPKVGWRMYQELTTISGGSTTTIDLGRALDANAVNGVMVYKNGLALLNQTALAGSPANNDEFSVSATGGAGGNCRITFGASLSDADSVLVWYLT
tara:strand:- start:368 stop:2182 length:1815 start_codon:yes stop_codon:yes gene_type:complete